MLLYFCYTVTRVFLTPSIEGAAAHKADLG